MSTLEFGLDTFLPVTVDRSGNPIGGDQVIRNTVEEAVLAEAVGIDSFNIGEHYRTDLMDSAGHVILAAIEAAWAAAQEDEPVPLPLRNDLRLAATHAARVSAAVVHDLYDLAGGPAIYDDSPLQRRFRDAYTATAHFQVNAASRELQGRILLGQPADTLMI